jgi:macrolide transport system ATP-binding/permease protein
VLTSHGVTVAGRLATPTSLSIVSGQRLVITGTNGAGKSTLLAVLAGHLVPTTGRVHLHPTAHVAFLTQEVPAWPPELTAHQIAEPGNGELAAARDASTAVRRSPTKTGLLDSRSMRTPASRLSQGQQRRLQLALCLSERPDLLLLDEPTNHLSAALVDELTEALQLTNAAVVVATHDRQLLHDLSDWPSHTLNGAADTPQP